MQSSIKPNNQIKNKYSFTNMKKLIRGKKKTYPGAWQQDIYIQG